MYNIRARVYVYPSNSASGYTMLFLVLHTALYTSGCHLHLRRTHRLDQNAPASRCLTCTHAHRKGQKRERMYFFRYVYLFIDSPHSGAQYRGGKIDCVTRAVANFDF